MADREDRAKAVHFIAATAQPALNEVVRTLRNECMVADAIPKVTSATVHVAKQGGLPTSSRDFEYTIEAVLDASGTKAKVSGTDFQTHTIQRGGRTLDLGEISVKDITEDFDRTFANVLSNGERG